MAHGALLPDDPDLEQSLSEVLAPEVIGLDLLSLEDGLWGWTSDGLGDGLGH